MPGPDHPVTIMVVVLLSETKGPWFAASLRTTVRLFSRGRQVIWVPAVPDSTASKDDFPSEQAWPDDVSGAVPEAGESSKVPGGDPAALSGPSAGSGEKEVSWLFRVHGTGAVAGNWEGIDRHRPDLQKPYGGRYFPGRRKQGRWKRYFSKRSAP